MLVNVNGETKELMSRDENGIECTADIMGGASDYRPGHDEDGRPILSEDDYDWWKKYLDTLQADEAKKAEMIEEYGSAAVEKALNEAFNGINDFDDHHWAYEAAWEALSE
jgi:hypothetical protein